MSQVPYRLRYAARRVGHKKRWEDNIKEWMGMELISSTSADENRTRGKGIVANSSVEWPYGHHL